MRMCAVARSAAQAVSTDLAEGSVGLQKVGHRSSTGSAAGIQMFNDHAQYTIQTQARRP